MSKWISKIIPSFFTIKEGSTSHLGLLSSGEKKETALRCSEPLRSKVGGPSKVFAILCGMGPPGCYGDQLAIILLKVSAWRGLTDWDHHFCSSLQYRSALVVARMRNIIFYSTFERITSGEVPIRVMAEILWPPLTICSKMEQKSNALFAKTIKHVLLDSLSNIQLFFANHYMNIHIVTTSINANW